MRKIIIRYYTEYTEGKGVFKLEQSADVRDEADINAILKIINKGK